jgi:hypothetical protein
MRITSSSAAAIRLAACKLAGVEPRFEQLNGRNPRAYIASANLQRRDLTKGQKAMALAMIYLVAEKGGRGKNIESRKAAESAGFSARRLAEARSVLAYSRGLAEDVLKENLSLDAALEKVEAEKSRAKGMEARRERLRKGAPDLPDLVAEERITLDEATAAWSQRETHRRAMYQDGVTHAARLNDFAGMVSAILIGADARDKEEQPIVVKRQYLENVRAAYKLLEEYCAREGTV